MNVKFVAAYFCDECLNNISIFSQDEILNVINIQKFLDERTPNFFEFKLLCDPCWLARKVDYENEEAQRAQQELQEIVGG